MRFAEDFPRAREGDWRNAVAGVLKGKDFARTLIGQTRDGFPIEPLLPRRADAEPIAGARAAGRWRIGARLDDPDPDRGNALIRDDLIGGADLVTLGFAGARAARGFGLPDQNPDTLERALDGVHCDLIGMRLEFAPFGARAAGDAIAGLVHRRRLPFAALEIDFGLAPLADWAVTGATPLPFHVLIEQAHELVTQRLSEGFIGPFLRCDGRPFHEAGASEGQELALVLAQGIAYLRAFEAMGVPLETARTWLSFTLAADADLFLGIAKFRALRLLWARVEEVAGLAGKVIPIHAETAWRMLARNDCHTNILRNTIAALAAGLGGADSIAVLPFTAPRGLPDAFARRLARNTGLILMDESQLHRVIDPAAGAGGIEALTDRLCARAWSLLQRIEAQDVGGLRGLPAALDNSFVFEMIREIRDARAADIATRREPITGVSEFPDLSEGDIAVLMPARPDRHEGPLPSMRAAEPFEALRDRAAGMARAPEVFLANLGPLAAFGARATFATNAFEAGGVHAPGNAGFAAGEGTDISALVAAYKASGSRIACLCGSDAAYADEAIKTARALKAAGAAAIFLAGRPGEAEPAYRAAGIEGFLFAGCDIIACLAAVLDRLEVIA
jgi:methylmalonyl-CoA mutase